MSKLLENPEALCNIVRRIAVEAGGIIMRYYDGLEDFEVIKKSDGSPVSLADQKAEEHIVGALYDLIPDVPVIGEELYSEGRMPAMDAACEYFWLVDALDGTREFVRGGEEFTVNIALIRNQSPVIGIVYAPVSEIMYAAHGIDTAVKSSPERKDDRPLRVRAEPKNGIVIARSKGNGYAQKLEPFLKQFKVRKQVRMGSSLKMCTIADARADMYPRFGPTCLWDTAAAHAVLIGAGGHVTDVDGKELRYAPDAPKMLNPEFIASSFVWWG